jgi:hypothetical protein
MSQEGDAAEIIDRLAQLHISAENLAIIEDHEGNLRVIIPIIDGHLRPNTDPWHLSERFNSSYARIPYSAERYYVTSAEIWKNWPEPFRDSLRLRPHGPPKNRNTDEPAWVMARYNNKRLNNAIAKPHKDADSIFRYHNWNTAKATRNITKRKPPYYWEGTGISVSEYKADLSNEIDLLDPWITAATLCVNGYLNEYTKERVNIRNNGDIKAIEQIIYDITSTETMLKINKEKFGENATFRFFTNDAGKIALIFKDTALKDIPIECFLRITNNFNSAVNICANTEEKQHIKDILKKCYINREDTHENNYNGGHVVFRINTNISPDIFQIVLEDNNITAKSTHEKIGFFDNHESFLRYLQQIKAAINIPEPKHIIPPPVVEEQLQRWEQLLHILDSERLFG